jgi:hypothetical protein
MRANDSTTPPGSGMQAPDKPVPAPRAVIGTPSSLATRTAAATSPVLDGKATSPGTTGTAFSVSSTQ